MKLYLVMFCCLLQGCTLLIDTHLISPVRFTLQKTEPFYREDSNCKSKFILPELQSLPKPPVISPKIANDREKTDAVLLDYIKTLKSLIRQEQLDIQEAYQKYVESCK